MRTITITRQQQQQQNIPTIHFIKIKCNTKINEIMWIEKGKCRHENIRENVSLHIDRKIERKLERKTQSSQTLTLSQLRILLIALSPESLQCWKNSITNGKLCVFTNSSFTHTHTHSLLFFSRKFLNFLLLVQIFQRYFAFSFLSMSFSLLFLVFFHFTFLVFFLFLCVSSCALSIQFSSAFLLFKKFYNFLGVFFY